jgi:hypothetical protein
MSATENVTVCNTPKGTAKPRLPSSEDVTTNNYNTFNTSAIWGSLNEFCESSLYEWILYYDRRSVGQSVLE